MLVEEMGATRLLLASRSGCTARDMQSVEAKLHLMSVVAVVVACDSAEGRNAGSLVCTGSLTAMLHAAGVLRDRMLRSLSANDLEASYAPKACGVWFVACGVWHVAWGMSR